MSHPKNVTNSGKEDVFKVAFYYRSLCHCCKENDRWTTVLKECPNCKVVQYCQKCQDDDFVDHNHNKVCQLLKLAREQCGNKDTRNDLGEVLRQKSVMMAGLTQLVELHLKRSLYPEEVQMCHYPGVCAVCYSKDAPVVCYRCHSVEYCTRDHQKLNKEQHVKYCDSLKLIRDLYRYRFYVYKDLKKSIKLKPIDAELTSLPDNRGKKKIFNFFLESNFSGGRLATYHRKVINSARLVPALHFVYALETCKFIENRIAKKPEITIHVVKYKSLRSLYPLSSTDKFPWDINMEFMHSWIKNLKRLNLVLVGYNPKNIELSVRKTKITVVNESYHSVNDTLPEPDLVCTFNCQFKWPRKIGSISRPDSVQWKKNIPELIRYKDVPYLMTALTMDVLEDNLESFMKFPSVKYYLEPRRNGYSPRRPYRNAFSYDLPVVYKDAYLAILYNTCGDLV